MYKATDLADGGAHGSVYKGFDSLDRPCAIKFIRPSIGDAKFVRDQAAAMARVESEHVIAITAVEDVEDPESGNMIPAIIMPWLDGQTLEKLLIGPKPTPEQIKRIGIGMVLGMKAVHDAGLVHGDFHFRNVMIGDTWVKLIDILYYKSLADETATVQQAKRQSDRNSLRSMLADLLTRISLDTADAFSRNLSPDSTLDDIHIAFVKATSPKVVLDIPALTDTAVARISDPAFVDGDDYATALSEEIDDHVVRPLIETIIAKGITKTEHKTLLRVLWDRLSEQDKDHICIDLSAVINREVPKGNFPPHLRMLSAFGVEGWSKLTRATSIRLENALATEILAGRYLANGGVTRGSFGTWVGHFYNRLSKPEAIRDNIVQLLRSGWDAQNYVGKYFMRFLPRLATNSDDRDRLIAAVAEAVTDNAWLVKSNLKLLPEDWQAEVAAIVESTKAKKLEAEFGEEPPPATEAGQALMDEGTPLVKTKPQFADGK